MLCWCWQAKVSGAGVGPINSKQATSRVPADGCLQSAGRQRGVDLLWSLWQSVPMCAQLQVPLVLQARPMVCNRHMTIARRYLGSRVCNVPRERLAALRVPPGARICTACLTARFDVTPSLIREALRQSSEQGLVIHNRCEGDHAIHLAEEHSQDISAQRKALELTALNNVRVRTEGPDLGAPHTPSTEALQSSPSATTFHTALQFSRSSLYGYLLEARGAFTQPLDRPVGACPLVSSVDVPGDRRDFSNPRISLLSYQVYVETDRATRDRPSAVASWSAEEVVAERIRSPS